MNFYKISYKYRNTSTNNTYEKYVDQKEYEQYSKTLEAFIEVVKCVLLDKDTVKKLSYSRRDLKDKNLLNTQTYISLGYV